MSPGRYQRVKGWRLAPPRILGRNPDGEGEPLLAYFLACVVCVSEHVIQKHIRLN